MKSSVAAVLAVMVMCLMACNGPKKSNGSQVPGSIQKLTTTFAQNSNCKDAHVDEMEFQSKKVYAFQPGSCGADMTTDVYDADGKLLGSLGGIRGNMKINSEDFSSAKLLRTTWKKQP